MEKLIALFSVFRKGSEVSDPAKWKNHQIQANVVGGFILALVALAKAFNFEIPIDENSSLVIGGGIVALVNVLLTMATSKKVGLKPAVQPESKSDQKPDDTYFG